MLMKHEESINRAKERTYGCSAVLNRNLTILPFTGLAFYETSLVELPLDFKLPNSLVESLSWPAR